MFKRKIILVAFLLIFFMAISAASAEGSDNATVSDVASNINDKVSAVKDVSLKTSSLSTTYGSGKYLKVSALDSIKKPVSKLKLTLKVFTGKKYKTVTKTTDSKGVVKYFASKLSVGKHKVIISAKDSKPKTTFVKISKSKLLISASKVIHKYKESKKFNVIVKNKETKKLMDGIKFTLKVFTGKKYKTYNLKTNKNGVASINTKSLGKGSHKVTVNVKATSKVRAASAKSTIKIADNSNVVKLKVNGKVLDVKLENNNAANVLLEKLKKGDITVHAREYGNFEKVGDLGFSLPQSDEYITTSPGDVVLYNGDEISVFYNSNSWEYTKLGKIQNSGDLKNILGSGDVTLVLSLK